MALKVRRYSCVARLSTLLWIRLHLSVIFHCTCRHCCGMLSIHTRLVSCMVWSVRTLHVQQFAAYHLRPPIVVSFATRGLERFSHAVSVSPSSRSPSGPSRPPRGTEVHPCAGTCRAIQLTCDCLPQLCRKRVVTSNVHLQVSLRPSGQLNRCDARRSTTCSFHAAVRCEAAQRRAHHISNSMLLEVSNIGTSLVAYATCSSQVLPNLMRGQSKAQDRPVPRPICRCGVIAMITW